MFLILFRSWRGVLDTTLCDKVCQWLMTGRWFSPGTLVSSTSKTDRHDITEILLNVALNTIKQINKHCLTCSSTDVLGSSFPMVFVLKLNYFSINIFGRKLKAKRRTISRFDLKSKSKQQHTIKITGKYNTKSHWRRIPNQF